MIELEFLMWNLKGKGHEMLGALTELYIERKPDFLLLIETSIKDSDIVKLSGNNLRPVMLNKKKEIRLYVSKNVDVNIVNDQELEKPASSGRRKQIKERLIFLN
jgi:hypothetical protein